MRVPYFRLFVLLSYARIGSKPMAKQMLGSP
jgi:hypothetical protein